MRNILFFSIATIGIWALLGRYSYRTQLEELQKEHLEVNQGFNSLIDLYNKLADYDYHIYLHSDSLANIIDPNGNVHYNVPGDSIQAFIDNDNL